MRLFTLETGGQFFALVHFLTPDVMCKGLVHHEVAQLN